MFNLGVPELLLILLICLLLFGASRLPEIARSLGQAIREFKRSMKEDDADHDKSGPSTHA